MKTQLRTIFLLLSALLMIQTVSCGATFSTMETVVQKDSMGIFRIPASEWPDSEEIRKEIPPSVPYPKITPRQLFNVLGNLFFEKESFWGSSSTRRVFEKKELERFTPYLARSMNHMDPAYRIVLITAYDPDNSVLSRRERVTALIWMDEAGLNVVFGEIREAVPGNEFVEHTDSLMKIYPINLNRAYRDLRLISSTDFQLKEVNGTIHETWAVFDPELIPKIQYISDEDLKRQRMEEQGLEQVGDDKEKEQPEEAVSEKGVMERLRELEKLKKAGLITDDEYREKREEILKDL